MPKDRFFNLPEEKRARIIKAAKQELSRVAFNEISINKIIQSAGIPRGSFYQYFEDKLDLLDYLMQGYKKIMEKEIERSIKENDGDLFQLLIDALDVTISYGMKDENYAFCKNIFSQLRLQECGSFEIFKVNEYDFTKKFIPYLNLKDFRYTEEDELMEIFEIMVVLIRNAVAQVFTDINKKEQVQKRFANKLEMLKKGILNG